MVDDFSRVTWVQLLKYKSNTFSVHKKFAAMIKTQFHQNILVLRSDNALEFDDNKCRDFFLPLVLFIKYRVLTDLNKTDE